MTDKITYPKNFITKVLFRIDFSQIQALENEPMALRDLLQASFPTMEPVVRTGIVFQAEIGKTPTTQEARQTIWQFSSADGSTHCNILPDSLVLESNSYKNYTTFSAVLTSVLDAFYTTYNPISISRVGLRYINEIKIPEEEDYLEWETYIHPLVSSILKYKPDGTELKRSLNTAEYSVDPETTVITRTGIFNSSYPAKLVQKEFVVDIDCYSNQNPRDKDSLMTNTNKYNDILTDTFESLIQDGLRTLLNKT